MEDYGQTCVPLKVSDMRQDRRYQFRQGRWVWRWNVAVVGEIGVRHRFGLDAANMHGSLSTIIAPE